MGRLQARLDQAVAGLAALHEDRCFHRLFSLTQSSSLEPCHHSEHTGMSRVNQAFLSGLVWPQAAQIPTPSQQPSDSHYLLTKRSQLLRAPPSYREGSGEEARTWKECAWRLPSPSPERPRGRYFSSEPWASTFRLHSKGAAVPLPAGRGADIPPLAPLLYMSSNWQPNPFLS